jgi:hypothetical protein
MDCENAFPTNNRQTGIVAPTKSLPMTYNPLVPGGKQSALKMEKSTTTQRFVQNGEYGRHHISDESVVNVPAVAIGIRVAVKWNSGDDGLNPATPEFRQEFLYHAGDALPDC